MKRLKRLLERLHKPKPKPEQTLAPDLANPSPARVTAEVMQVWNGVAMLVATPEGMAMMEEAAVEYTANVDHEE